MKKVLALFVVLGLVVISTVALAADVTVGGNVSIRSRNFDSLNFNSKNDSSNQMDTQTKYMIDVNAKSGDVKGKISFWNDFDTWANNNTTNATEQRDGIASASTGSTAGHTHTYNNNTNGIRESWILFPVADTGFVIKAGHQLLQLGHGIFFRNMHFGSDAWVAYRDDGPNHLGFVNVKVQEGATNKADDVDAYVLVDTYKINDATKVGIDITSARDRKNALGFGGNVNAQNIGLNFTGKVGPMDLKAEIDLQQGKVDSLTGGTSPKLKGSALWVRGDVKMAPATVNFTVARGSGPKVNQTDFNQFVNFLDIDPHVAFLYEYKLSGPCGANKGFCNTTAINVGGGFDVSKNLNIGAQLWVLQATEKVNDQKAFIETGAFPADQVNDLGTEIDVNLGWKLGDGLTWNWNLGYLAPGKGLGKDPATGIQGILSYTF